jgi:hypothetical protein
MIDDVLLRDVAESDLIVGHGKGFANARGEEIEEVNLKLAKE